MRGLHVFEVDRTLVIARDVADSRHIYNSLFPDRPVQEIEEEEDPYSTGHVDDAQVIQIYWDEMIDQEEYQVAWEGAADPDDGDPDDDSWEEKLPARTWADVLGRGLLALAGGGCAGFSGWYRASWRESRERLRAAEKIAA